MGDDPRTAGRPTFLRVVGAGAEGRTGRSCGITLLKGIRERIHATASDHGVILASISTGDCQICWEADPKNEMSTDLSKMTPEELDSRY